MTERSIVRGSTFTRKISLPLIAMTSLLALSIPVDAQSARPRTKQTAEQVLAKIPGIQFRKNLPDNFPIAKYPMNVTKTNFTFSTKGTPSAAGVIITKDPPDKVNDFYVQFCQNKGWKIQTPTAKAMEKIGKQGKLYMIAADKDQEKVYIYCIADKKTGGTRIDISWSKNHA